MWARFQSMDNEPVLINLDAAGSIRKADELDVSVLTEKFDVTGWIAIDGKIVKCDIEALGAALNAVHF